MGVTVLGTPFIGAAVTRRLTVRSTEPLTFTAVQVGKHPHAGDEPALSKPVATGHTSPPVTTADLLPIPLHSTQPVAVSVCRSGPLDHCSSLESRGGPWGGASNSFWLGRLQARGRQAPHRPAPRARCPRPSTTSSAGCDAGAS
jgi:hypothetical protein